MQSTHQAELDLPMLPNAARTAHIFPKLASGSLLSIGQLCDAGCTALFEKRKLYIFHKGKIILQGTRQPSRLWTIDSTTTPSIHHTVNTAIDMPTIAERIKFYHASLFSPTLDTLQKAIKAGYLTSFPGFTHQQLRKYLPTTIATNKGHLHAQRSNIQSTRRKEEHKYHLYNAFTPALPQLKPPTLIPPDDSPKLTKLYP